MATPPREPLHPLDFADPLSAGSKPTQRLSGNAASMLPTGGYGSSNGGGLHPLAENSSSNKTKRFPSEAMPSLASPGLASGHFTISSPGTPGAAANDADVLRAGNELLRSSDGVLADMDGMLGGRSQYGVEHEDEYTSGRYQQAAQQYKPLRPHPLAAKPQHAAGSGALRGGVGAAPISQGYGYSQAQQQQPSLQQHQQVSAPFRGYGGYDLNSFPTNNDGSDAAGYRALARVHRFVPHTFLRPTFCDACSKLIVGLYLQGLSCVVCSMAVHGECQHTMCTAEHRCRAPEKVVLAVDLPEGMAVPSVPQAAFRGTAAAGAAATPAATAGDAKAAVASVAAASHSSEDPLDSPWHKHLLRNRQTGVPDTASPACMVCDSVFNVIRRRHHCRRCGACVCGGCSATSVTDTILVKDVASGQIVRRSCRDPVRVCRKCIKLVDERMARKLRENNWGAKNAAAAAAAASSARSGQAAVGAAEYRRFEGAPMGPKGGFQHLGQQPEFQQQQLRGSGYGTSPPRNGTGSSGNSYGMPAQSNGVGGGGGAYGGYSAAPPGSEGYGADYGSNSEAYGGGGDDYEQPSDFQYAQYGEEPQGGGYYGAADDAYAPTPPFAGGTEVPAAAAVMPPPAVPLQQPLDPERQHYPPEEQRYYAETSPTQAYDNYGSSSNHVAAAPGQRQQQRHRSPPRSLWDQPAEAAPAGNDWDDTRVAL